MIKYNFAVFILSHGRTHNVKTLTTLKKHGYTGRTFIVCDNEDDQLEDYRQLKGVEQVLVFDKQAEMDSCDRMDNFNNRKVILYARNACFNFARELKLDYFLELDDDYVSFEFRKPENNKLKVFPVKDLDRTINSFLEYLENNPFKSIAFVQGGDLIGGVRSMVARSACKRKAMNSFFCKTDRPFWFQGSINEDVNTYVLGGIRGDLFLQVNAVSLVQSATQANKGGMTEQYLEFGTYVKSFYSVMCAPSCVTVEMLNSNHKRLHHKISWNNCTPCIISGKYRK